MRNLSRARRRVVLMCCCLGMLAATSPALERVLLDSLHVPKPWFLVPGMTLEVVALVFVIKAFLGLKASEARETAGSGSREA